MTKFSKLFKHVLVGSLVWASVAHAVSQVGGGKIQNLAEGYEANVPIQFSDGTVYANDDVQLNGPFMLGGAHQFGRQKLNVYLFRNEFPAFATVVDRQAFRKTLERLGWMPASHADACVEAFTTPIPDSINILLAWGEGRGILISGADTPDIREAANTIADSLRVFPGACAWK